MADDNYSHIIPTTNLGNSECLEHNPQSVGQSDVTGRDVDDDDVTSREVGSGDKAMVSETYLTVIDDEVMPPVPEPAADK